MKRSAQDLLRQAAAGDQSAQRLLASLGQQPAMADYHKAKLKRDRAWEAVEAIAETLR